MTPIESVINKLQEVTGQKPQPTSDGYSACCPAHPDTNPSLSITETEDGTVLLHCHSGCATGDIVTKLGLEIKDLFASVKRRRQVDAVRSKHVYQTLEDAVEAARKHAGQAQNHEFKLTNIYHYADTTRRDVFAVARFDPVNGGQKTFRPFHAVDDGWCSGDGDGLLPLYGLPSICSGTGRVYLVEGEKCAEACLCLGLSATTSAHGSKSVDKTDWSPLAGREVIIIPDCDEPGNKYAVEAARKLIKLTPAAKVKIIALPGLENKGDDIVEFIALHGGNAVDVRAMIEKLADEAKQWEDADALNEILDCAPLTISWPLCVLGSASYLATWAHIGDAGLKRMILRSDGQLFADGVKAARPVEELDVSVDLPNQPRLDKVLSGAALKRYIAGTRADPLKVFARVFKCISHFMDFGHSTGDQTRMAAMVTLYVMATYFLDAFNVIGYLWPNGDKGSGKTKLISVVTSLGFLGELITAGASFASTRDLAQYGAVLGFDDSENIMDTHKFDSDKRALLLAGNRRGVTIPLKFKQPDGNWGLIHVNAFCPRLFSAINLPDETLASRTIIVPLLRSSDDIKANLDPSDIEMWPVNRREIIDDLWLLGLEHLCAVKAYDREVVKHVSISGRELEPWRAILALALWLQEKHGACGLFNNMLELVHAYQIERVDVEEVSPARVLIEAVHSMRNPGEGDVIVFTPGNLAEVMNTIADSQGLAYYTTTFTNAKKAGNLLKQLRFRRCERSSAGQRWSITVKELAGLARSYGVSLADGNVVSVVSAVSAVSAVSPSMSASTSEYSMFDTQVKAM